MLIVIAYALVLECQQHSRRIRVKYKLLSLLLILSLVANSTLAFAADTVSPLLNGQKHYYSVQLRSDEQALVYGKIIFEAGDTAQKSIELKLPEGISVSNLSAQQILAKSTTRTCTVYETQNDWRERTQTDVLSPTGASPTYEQSRNCITYNEYGINDDFDFDKDTSSSSHGYYSPSYYSTRSSVYEYKDIDVKQDGQTLTFTLPNEIKPHKQGSILVSYTSSDFVSGFFGRFSYEFRTLIAAQMIERATVAINFDEDLYSEQSTQKRVSESASDGAGIAQGADSAQSYRSDSMDDTQLGIGRGGRYVQTQGKMLPGDTLAVKGDFATRSILLADTEIAIALILLVIIAAGILSYRRYRKAHPRAAAAAASGTTATSPRWWRSTVTIRNEEVHIARNVRSSVIAITATAVGIWLVSMLFLPSVDDYSSSEITNTVFPIMYVTSTAAIILFGLIIIPGLEALRHGVRQAYAWAILHIATILVITVVLWLVLSAFINEPAYDSPMPYSGDYSPGILNE